MGKVDTRVKPFEFDEESVRKAFLEGQTNTQITARHNGNERAITLFISQNKQRWLDEARFNRIASDDRRTVLPFVITRENGQRYIMPISLPRNSFHLRALSEVDHV